MSSQARDAANDLRSTPRRVGNVLAWIGERLERAGVWLQENAAEFQWRKWSAFRRWGQ